MRVSTLRGDAADPSLSPAARRKGEDFEVITGDAAPVVRQARRLARL